MSHVDTLDFLIRRKLPSWASLAAYYGHETVSVTFLSTFILIISTRSAHIWMSCDSLGHMVKIYGGRRARACFPTGDYRLQLTLYM